MKIKSLSKENEFKQVFKVGDVFGNRVLVFYFLKNEKKENRLGIIVSKKVSKKAVVRNKVKRRIKEAYRHNEDSFTKGYDIILIAKESIKDVPFSSLEKSLKHLFYKKNLMRP
ncbi:ribonuclease P protein component [Acetobacterium woodii]|uniref:Ribonuclease P protein component n=1 Tax=Acetobacterium woodii (strain ATCC 29683 / DSM 1030 / JCM 2381 / KCTC 1655 / WB1) TaxID=931626 RepID=H6LCY2_ACEWD|nr:ribonuclease P protein component [Acetobacterium woodii]AFA50287.1 ribonuclease P [Acetobacterium woodii DSM 1030]